MSTHSYYIPPEVRYFIVSEASAGTKYQFIIELVQSKFGRNVSKSAISSIVSKYDEYGKVEDLPRSGRPSKLSEMEEEKLIEAVEQDRKLTANNIAKNPKLNPPGLSSRTITRKLNNRSLFDATSVPQSIEDKNKADRLRLALSQTKDINWDYVIFSDESDLFPDRPGKIHYRKYPGEIVDLDGGPDYRWDPRKVKVWGAISKIGVGTLIRYEGTLRGSDYSDLLNRTLLKDFQFKQYIKKNFVLIFIC